MEVKEGYKKTDIGVIPEDWELDSIGNLFNILAGGDVDRENFAKEKKGDFIYPIYANSLVNKGLYGFTRLPKYKKGSITVTARGSLGHAEYRNHPFDAIVRLLVLEPKSKMEGYLFSEYINERVKFAFESTGVPQLTAPQISKYKVAYPKDFNEQIAISLALSDVDKLIDSLDKLIVKNRNIKLGAMRELLAGKKRLPGFGGEWKIKELGEYGKFKGGSGFPVKFQGALEGEYPFYKVSDMNNKGNAVYMKRSNNWISEDVRKVVGANIFPERAIVFAKIGAAIFLERKKILSQKSCVDNNMMGFILDESIADYQYFHFLFLSMKLGSLVSATALPSLNGKDIGAMKFAFPEKKEQIVIAQTLKGMDKNLEILEDELNKYKNIKQGMMQELLTGKTRLI